MLALSLAAALGVPAAAPAHAGDPNIQTLVTGTEPSLPGVTIVAVQSTIAPALSAVNTSARTLEVLDPSGIAFLRLGPGGTFGNRASRFLAASAAPGGEASVPPPGPGAGSRWVRLSRQSAWAWYDPRVPAVAAAPAAARARSTPTLLDRFGIPLRYGGRGARASGEVDYRPPQGGAVATMTSPAEIAPGLRVALLPGSDPVLYLQNDGPRTVTVEGQEGEPFAQIGPAGVRVNLRSPIHQADVAARGTGGPVRLARGQLPMWRQVSATPSYDWLDPRPRFLPRWSIPLRVGGRVYEITGTLHFQPATTVAALERAGAQRRSGHGAGSAGSPSWLTVVLALVVAAGLILGALAVQARRARRWRA